MGIDLLVPILYEDEKLSVTMTSEIVRAIDPTRTELGRFELFHKIQASSSSCQGPVPYTTWRSL